MIEFILNTKKEKIEVEYSSKEEKSKIKNEIEILMNKGFNKNTAKAIILIELLKIREYQESLTDKNYVKYNIV